MLALGSWAVGCEHTTCIFLQKCVSRIGEDLNMPSNSLEEHTHIFKALFELKSFTQKLGQPNISNLFAWHAGARDQMREFNATKCIFAAVFADDPDPDSDWPF